MVICHAEEPRLKLYTIIPGADVFLQDDYAVMLINDGDSDKPVPRYILAIRSSRTLIDTRDFKIFQTALTQIPKGKLVFIYDSCTVPRSYGLTDAQDAAFYKAIQDAGLRTPGEDGPLRMTCYCKALEQERIRRFRAERAKKEKAEQDAAPNPGDS